MKAEQAQEIQTLLDARFSLNKPKALQQISLMGCCEEQDAWYHPYRQLNWLEFGHIILQTKQGGLDSTDFVGIQPLAFHYFSPGILWAITESILRYQEIAYHLWGWLGTLEGHSRKLDPGLKERVEIFSSEQKDLVRQCLELANEVHEEMKGYRKREIDWGLTQLWAT